MEPRTAYHTQIDKKNILKLRKLLKELPPFAKDYFRAIGTTTSSRTKISYAYDLKVFFQYLLKEHPAFQDYAMSDLQVDVLDQIDPMDIEEYQEYLQVYQSQDTGLENTNGERGIKRKISSLRSFYAYFYKRELIHTNPSLLVDMPKLHDKPIVKLDPDEVATLLDYIEHAGDTLTGQRKIYYEKTKERDLAIFTLLLGTGLRVSECVGLDIEDIDFRNGGIKVHRKGGNEMIVYFGDEVAQALLTYLESRKKITPLPGHEHALFYSTQRRRIGVKAVENLVKKYAQEVTALKKITPHKLRSTYGTTLYEETGDIYLVADVLGHKDVNTTRKHYADLGDAHRRKAASAVHLRKKEERD